jgi:hypothetical protein
MSKSSSVPWWSSLGFGKAAPAKDSDYADMGTAFGLDASMDTLPMPAEPAAADKQVGRLPPGDGGRRAKR